VIGFASRKRSDHVQASSLFAAYGWSTFKHHNNLFINQYIEALMPSFHKEMQQLASGTMSAPVTLLFAHVQKAS
jgi:hypothetical protein